MYRQIPGSVQGKAEWGSELFGPVGDIPAHGRGVQLDDLI